MVALRFAEEPNVGLRHGECRGDILEADCRLVDLTVDHRGGPRGGQRDVDRQAENGAGVHLELTQSLGRQGHQPGVVRAGTDLGEVDVVALDEQFDAEDASATQLSVTEPGGDPRRDRRRRGHRVGAHLVRLPALDVVAVDLLMPDRGTEHGGQPPGPRVHAADGQQGDLVVELDEALDDRAFAAHPAARGGGLPRALEVVGRFHHRLALARRRHHRLHHARIADLLGGDPKFGERVGEQVRRGGQPEFLVRQAADALPVHRRHHGRRGGYHLGEPPFGGADQGFGGDRLDFGHHVGGLVLVDDREHGVRVGHVDDLGVVSDLLPRCVGIPVDGDDLHPEPLEGDHHLFAEFTGAEQEHLGGRRAQRCAENVGRADRRRRDRWRRRSRRDRRGRRRGCR